MIDDLALMDDQNRSQHILLTARPGQGKMSFALTLARQAIFELERPVVFISPEMNKESLVQRLLSGVTEITLENLINGEMTDQEHKQFIEAMSDFNDASVYINDSPSINTSEVKNVISDWRQQHGSSLVIVDYFELIDGPDEKGSREEELNHIADKLNQITEELGVSILSLGQLERNLDDREDNNPSLDNLRSLSVENAEIFDQVWFLYQIEKSLESESSGELTSLKVASRSDETTSYYPLLFERDYCRFREHEPVKE